MLQTKKISCIIPAYNEEKKIAEVIRDLKNKVNEIIVVDDCSNDNTFNIAKAENITVLRHGINRGQGAALETGNQYALKNKADIIVHFDADGQFLSEEIKDLTKPILKKKADIVFGSRFLGKKSNLPFVKKHFIMPLGRFLNRFLWNIKLSDPQSGFRAMSSETARKIKIENDRMAHCSEILKKAHELNLKIMEVPITVIYHEYGQKFSGGLRIIKDLFLNKLLK